MLSLPTIIILVLIFFYISILYYRASKNILASFLFAAFATFSLLVNPLSILLAPSQGIPLHYVILAKFLAFSFIILGWMIVGLGILHGILVLFPPVATILVRIKNALPSLNLTLTTQNAQNPPTPRWVEVASYPTSNEEAIRKLLQD